MNKNTGNEYAEIAVSLPLRKTFHYSIPKKLRGKVESGKRVWVEFGKRKMIGYVVGLAASSGVKDVKPIKGVIDEIPVISPQMRQLCGWIKDTYLCSLGQAMDATIPGVLKKGKVSVKARRGGALDGDRSLPGTLPNNGTRPHTSTRMDAVTLSAKHTLTAEQGAVMKSVLHKIDKEDFTAFLLHGITSSGKTEVYLQAIERVLAKGKTTIALVPEIALTPQTVGRFISRFGNLVAVMHSALLGSSRCKEWQRIASGDARIVVGARSAIFSPVKNLGLIIVDEEHETSYKQEDVPRYHARDVAFMRAKLSNCPIIFGSATPSLESYYLAGRKKMELVRLTKRIDERNLPKVKIVDMRMELATRKRLVMFSRVLIEAVQRALNKNEQVIIFLNRRGFSTYVNCKKCGFVLKCRRCDSVLVYHYQTRSMVCHYCNSRMPPPHICPRCKSSYMKYFGIGTEKVESEIARIFPGAKIARMDTDSTSKRGSHDRILGEFKKHNIDILIGTQMIAKGLDFPRVTLVAVVNADVSLNLPDFRASERTFNLLTQVGGRAGRGEAPGEVIVQTYAPEHYAILCASKHDYEKFYREEIKSRKELSFPPFTHIIRLTMRSRNEKKTIEASGDLKKFLENALRDDIEVVGAAPSPISRVRGYYRWNIFLKAKNRSTMCEALVKALERYRKPHGMLLAIDVDPISM